MVEDALEPLLQATNAMMRWAPVARLIQDLDGESAIDAQPGGPGILKLAVLDTPGPASPGRPTAPGARPTAMPPADDPLGRRVAAITDEQVTKVLALSTAVPE